MAASSFGEAATPLSARLPTRTNNGSHGLPFFYPPDSANSRFSSRPPLMSA